MRKVLTEAKPAFTVKWNDRRNFRDVGSYLAISIPSMLLLVFEFSALDIQAILTGHLSLNDQASFVILQNFVLTIYVLPQGVGTAGCTLVGKYLGKGNIEQAKKVIKGLYYYSLVMCGVEGLFMLICRNLITDLFTADEAIRTIGHKIVWTFMIAQLLDFWQCSLSGVIRGLGRQTLLSSVAFTSYYIIMVPLSFYLTFNAGSHSSAYDQINILTTGSSLMLVQGLGQVGTWLAYSVGLTHMVMWQLYIIQTVDWKQAIMMQETGLVMKLPHLHQTVPGRSLKNQKSANQWIEIVQNLM